MWVQAHSAVPENQSGPLGRMRGGSGAKLPCRALALALISACSVPAAAWSPPAVGQLGLKFGDALGAGRGAASVTKGRAPAAGCSISMLGRRDVIAGAVAAGIAAPAWADGAKVEKIASKVVEAPISYNELDVEAAAALEKGLADEAIKGSSVFSFRGDKLLKASPEGVLKYMSRRNAVFLGESHISKADKILAKNILVELGKIRGDENLAVGLEMVQMPFQNVLDWYVYKAPVSKESDRQLFLATEWRQRWGWNFDNYLPVLRYCQLKKIRMLALNVEEEATSRVMSKGLTALTGEERDRLILDKAGFMGESMSSTFPSYVDAVLKPSFKQHVSMGIFEDDEKVFTNFVSNRILWDETMASTSCRYLARNPDKLLVGLVGGDHVKTGHGIPARIERILENIGFPNSRTASVALNPTWKLYSQSKTLMQLKDLETSMGVNFGRQSGTKPKPADIVAEEKDLSEEGWGAPPRPDHHPFSDIIWYG